MNKQLSQTFTLEPLDNKRLRSLCGAGDKHLSLIKKHFDLSVAHCGFTFTVQLRGENHPIYCWKVAQSAVGNGNEFMGATWVK
ncbi:ATPase [Aggregatibacter actinomycetemcomitans]|uniref:ATPase n=1 Tax=Aggregatibacter actinomycetemcomitans TaxID=714 RepID=UPI0011DBDF67|nr:ATPase [Aggregatibacter actinomycetemcomitans]TYA51952.1 ATPase [Aggregatibacter actinomycetemcomitans]TYB30050.1 ATPase [Aggregatibacter actinomycetemcomitans]